MPLHVKDNGAWKTPRDVYVKDSSTWKHGIVIISYGYTS